MRGKQHRQLKIGIVAVLSAAFVLLAAYASNGILGSLEKDIFKAIYHSSETLWPLALAITQLGSVWMLLAVVGLLFVVRWRPEPAVAVALAGTLVVAASSVVKEIVGRPRPVGLLEDVSAREVIVRGLGFPSIHVALATAMSVTVVMYLPRKWWWLPVPIIVLVGWSRIYLGVHTPLDIIGGILLGSIVALVATFIPLPIPKSKATKTR